MCKAMEEMISDFVTDEKKMAAIRMLESGKLKNEDIAEFAGLTLEIVEELAKELQAV